MPDRYISPKVIDKHLEGVVGSVSMGKLYANKQIDKEVVDVVHSLREHIVERALGNRWKETDLGFGSTLKFMAWITRIMLKEERVPTQQEVHEMLATLPQRGTKPKARVLKIPFMSKMARLSAELWCGHAPCILKFGDLNHHDVLCKECNLFMLGNSHQRADDATKYPSFGNVCRVPLGEIRRQDFQVKAGPHREWLPESMIPAHPDQIRHAKREAAMKKMPEPVSTGPSGIWLLDDVKHLLPKQETEEQRDDDNDRDGNSDGHPNPQEAPRGEEGDAEAHPGGG